MYGRLDVEVNCAASILGYTASHYVARMLSWPKRTVDCQLDQGRLQCGPSEHAISYSDTAYRDCIHLVGIVRKPVHLRYSCVTHRLFPQLQSKV